VRAFLTAPDESSGLINPEVRAALVTNEPTVSAISPNASATSAA
jgi:hypothetical protein